MYVSAKHSLWNAKVAAPYHTKVSAGAEQCLRNAGGRWSPLHSEDFQPDSTSVVMAAERSHLGHSVVRTSQVSGLRKIQMVAQLENFNELSIRLITNKISKQLKMSQKDYG